VVWNPKTARGALVPSAPLAEFTNNCEAIHEAGRQSKLVRGLVGETRTIRGESPVPKIVAKWLCQKADSSGSHI